MGHSAAMAAGDSAVLARHPRARPLRRIARLVQIRGLIALRKLAAVIAVPRHLGAAPRVAAEAVRHAAVRLTVAAPMAEDTAASSLPQRFIFITIFPRPGRAALTTGPLFILTSGISSGIAI